MHGRDFVKDPGRRYSDWEVKTLSHISQENTETLPTEDGTSIVTFVTTIIRGVSHPTGHKAFSN